MLCGLESMCEIFWTRPNVAPYVSADFICVCQVTFGCNRMCMISDATHLLFLPTVHCWWFVYLCVCVLFACLFMHLHEIYHFSDVCFHPFSSTLRSFHIVLDWALIWCRNSNWVWRLEEVSLLLHLDYVATEKAVTYLYIRLYIPGKQNLLIFCPSYMTHSLESGGNVWH